MKESLSACLDGFRQSGQLDSSGEFTLSRDHAQKKLQQFTLPEARLYVLNLVASAVVGKASFIKFESDADELWMTSDGQLEEAGALENFESLVFSSGTSSALKELAIGLSGILPLKPKHVQLDVDDGRDRFRLSWDGQRFQFEKQGSGGPTPCLKLHVQEKMGSRVARKFAAKLGGGMLPDSEEDAIFRYCNRCPIPVMFNGKSANRPVILGNAQYLTFSDTAFPQGHIFADLAKSAPKTNSAPPGVAGLLAVGGRLAPWVTLVFQGVNFRLPENAFDRPALRGIVYADSLRKDLSQVQLVQDEEFRRLMDHINAEARAIPL